MNREVIICLSSEKAEVSYNATGVVGSFEFITLIELKLCKARKFAEMMYYPCLIWWIQKECLSC